MSNAGGPAWVAGTAASPVRPHGAGRTSPIAICQRDPSGLGIKRMTATSAAGLLDDLVNMIGAPLANPFGVVFEAP